MAESERLRGYLELEDYRVKTFQNIKGICNSIHKCPPDAIIIDLQYEDGSGFSLIKKIRQHHLFPIIILTKRTGESDRIIGFELGCDDYITIPYSQKELILRLKAIFKRVEGARHPAREIRIWIHDERKMELDKQRHLVTLDEKEVQLTSSEWKILSVLVQNPGILLSREKLLQLCFNTNGIYDRIIDTHIKNIRAKIGDEWIETVRGYGYKFLGKPSENMKTDI